jgi:hypothetical protein
VWQSNLFLIPKAFPLGTKVVEDKAVGLPVLFNSNVLSGAKYVQAHHTGKGVAIGLDDRDISYMPLYTAGGGGFPGAARSIPKLENYRSSGSAFFK